MDDIFLAKSMSSDWSNMNIKLDKLDFLVIFSHFCGHGFQVAFLTKVTLIFFSILWP